MMFSHFLQKKSKVESTCKLCLRLAAHERHNMAKKTSTFLSYIDRRGNEAHSDSMVFVITISYDILRSELH